MIRLIPISVEDLPLDEIREMAAEIELEIAEGGVSVRGIGSIVNGEPMVATVQEWWSGTTFHRVVWPLMAFKGGSVQMLVAPGARLVARGVFVRPASDEEVEPFFYKRPEMFRRGGWWEVRVD